MGSLHHIIVSNSLYRSSNAQIVLPTLKIRVVRTVSMNLLWVKRPAIRRQTSSLLSHAKRPGSVADAQCTCSTGEYAFIVGQTPGYWPSNVQLSKLDNWTFDGE